MDFNSILIGSEDPARLAEYYTKLLGEPAYAGNGYWAWKLGAGFVTLGPHSEVKGKNDTPGRLIWNIVTDDVKGDFEKFKAAGAIVVTAPYEFEAAPGSQIATFEDLDGNYFQLMNAIEM
jgi:predicted enzyme related to lactoylglutathione lyase